MKKTRFKLLLKIIIFLVVAVVLIWRFPVVKDIIDIIVISFVIAYALKPAQQFFMRFKLGKRSSSILLIIIVASVVLGMIWILVPSIYNEGQSIIESADEFKEYYNGAMGSLSSIGKIEELSGVMDDVYKKAGEAVRNFASNFIDKIIETAGNVLAYLVIPPIIYFFLSDGDEIFLFIMKYLPIKNKYSLRKTGEHIDKVMGRYVISQFQLCGIIGVMTYLVLIILGVRYPIMLSLINAFFNIIPYFGPVIGAVPVVIVALLMSIKKAVIVIICLGVIQQVEGNIIGPKMIGESVDSHPLTILLLLIAGEGIGGIVGMVLIIPVWTMLKMMFFEFQTYLF